MSEMFHAPEGALQANLGLLAGTVIWELRMHPYIDDQLEGGHWNYRPEYLEFTVLSVQRDSYRCQYSGEADTFWWSIWREQPNHGFMRDGCTTVRYYIKEEPLPPPYEGKPIKDIPLDVIVRADAAMKEARAADKKWMKLMGIPAGKKEKKSGQKAKSV